MRVICAVLGVLSCLSGCAADGVGDLAIVLSGEDAAVDGFAPPEVVDGWTVRFDRYLAAVGPIALEAAGGERFVDETIYVADLHRGDAELPPYEGLAAQRWRGFSFFVVPPTPSDEVVPVGGVPAEDLQRLIEGRFTHLVEGRATKDEQMVTFSWGLRAESHNLDCTNGVDGTAGVVVTPSGQTRAEITLHLEHLLFDALGSEHAELRFDAIAAMADDEGHVSWEALAQQSLTDLRDADGQPLLDENGDRVVYDPGSAEASHLQDFIEAAVRTQAHLGGEGLCTVAAVR